VSSPDTPLTAADVSVVIPTRNRWPTLQLTLDALAAQTCSGFETIVVADGRDQDVPDLPGVHVLQQDHAGPGVARNLAARESERRLLLFIGDDMVPVPELVAAHVEGHARNPDPRVGILGRIEWHPQVPRDRLHRWLQWSGSLFDYTLLDEPLDDAGWQRFYSSNVSLKRELFWAADGFDPAFVFDYEDLDFGYRLGEHGFRLLYQPRARTQHLHPYDWPAVERRYVSRARAERLMVAKHDWFKPWFHDQIVRRTGEPRASALWAWVVDGVPRRFWRLRRTVEDRADRYYLQRLAPAFLREWEAPTSDHATPGTIA
jgi:GT2 family glycosyltransferase